MKRIKYFITLMQRKDNQHQTGIQEWREYTILFRFRERAFMLPVTATRGLAGRCSQFCWKENVDCPHFKEMSQI